MTTFTKNQHIVTLTVAKGADHNDVEHTLQPGARGFVDSIETLPAPQGLTYTVVIETGLDDESHIVNVFDETDGDITQFISPTIVHQFETSGEAYDATQYRDDIANGDVLLVVSEGVVGVADTWPVAVTIAAGKLHTPGEGYSLASVFEGRAAAVGIAAAKAVATRHGFAVRE